MSGSAPQKPLSIQNIALSQFEDGPSVARSYEFASGETVFFSFQVAGYKAEGEEEPGIKLQSLIEAKDPAGVPIVEPYTSKVAAALAREDKEWMPKVRHTILIPPLAPSGAYRIAIVVQDEVAKAEARKEIEFRVRGREVEPSPALVIRNLHFYRGEEDKEPLVVGAYRRGDSVWIKFDITGYRFAEKNRFDVAYGITVLRPDGEASFNNPEAAAERDESFYPRPYVPAMLSLTLPKDVQTGQYTVIIGVADRVGGQKCEARQTFTVEP